jgi:hypothetical protein
MIFFDNISTLCLPIDASILGIALPIIIQTVGQIDIRYNSIRLVQRFKSEKLYHCFLGSLIIAIIILIYNNIAFFLWKYDWGVLNDIMSQSSNILVLGSTIILIYFLFKITMLIILYYDYQKLYWYIRNKIDIRRGDVEKDIRDLAELGKFILLKDDNKTSANFYQLLYDYSNNKTRNKVFEVVELDDWFYDIILLLNETLCRERILSISIVNGNDLLKILIPENPESVISEKTYKVLWRTLQQQLYYEKDDLVYEYWMFAYQYTWLRLKPIESSIIIEDPLLNEKNVRNKNKRDEQIKRFKEFHIAFCAYILYSKKHDLLQRVINYTSSVPYQFPLVPSTFCEIVDWFYSLNKFEKTVFYYQSNYHFLGVKGIDAGNTTLFWCNKYLALLLFRLNSFEVVYMSNWSDPWNKPKIPISLKEATEYLTIIENLKWFFEDWRKNNVINLINQFGWNNGDIEKKIEIDEYIDKYIDKYIDEINAEITKIRKNLQLSSDKIKQFKERSIEIISDTVYSYKCILHECSNPGNNYVKEVINASYTRPIDKEAFSDDQTKHFADYDEVVASNVVKEFYHLYSLSFYKNSKRFISIDYDNFLQAIEKLIGEKTTHYVVICFGLNLEYFANKLVNQLEKVSGDGRNYSKYTYKENIEIHSLPSGCNSIMDNNVVIINKDDLPCYQKQEPPEETMAKFKLVSDFDEKKDIILYNSILSNNFPEEHSKLDSNKFCIATIYYCILLYWKKNAEVVNLRLITKYTDTGVGEDISKLKEL